MTSYRIKWITRIDDISRRSTTVGGRKDNDGNATLTVEDAGWYIRCGFVSFFCGYEEPSGLAKGDDVMLTLQKARAPLSGAAKLEEGANASSDFLENDDGHPDHDR